MSQKSHNNSTQYRSGNNGSRNAQNSEYAGGSSRNSGSHSGGRNKRGGQGSNIRYFNAEAVRRSKASRASHPSSGGEAAVSGWQRQHAGSRARAERRPLEHDYSLIFIVLFFLAFGLIMLYSTSSYEAGLEFGDSAYYLKRQLIAVCLGLVLMVIVSRIPLRLWRQFHAAIYLFSAGLVVLIIPFGTTVNGARRWIRVAGVSIQPAEICKLAVIVSTAVLISNASRAELKSFWWSLLLLVPALIQAAMIYFITRNMSSAIIIAAIAVCMLFVATEDYKRYILLAFVAAGLFALWVYLAMNGSGGGTFRSGRIRYWLDPQAYADSGALQTLQGLYGIGSGGLTGKGLGQSMQKLGYIPEAQNDMIFSIICEELGLFGAVSIILMFIVLCWRMLVVATHARDLFRSMIVIGVMAQIAVQVILNIAVVTNTIPNTGVTLPFFSYGGSAIVIQLVEIGLVFNVARDAEKS